MAGTRWAKIDLSYFRNPKVTAVSRQATLLHLASILWSGDQLTDGHVPPEALPELLLACRSHPNAKRPDELVTAGLWVPNGDGWHIHDFEVMNPQLTRAVVEKHRAKWRRQKGYEP